MKISDNITIYSGMRTQDELQAERESNGEKQNRRTVYAGTLNNDLLQNRILERRKEAREKAMKVIGDAFAGDCAIDEDLQKRRTRVEELESEILELEKNIKAISEEQESLKTTYGITEDSVEQQELELIRKSRNKLTKSSLTPEESTRAAAIEARGLTDYQQRQLELDEAKNAYRETLNKNRQNVLEENAVIRGTKMERLKHSPMTKAQRQAEEILESANEEIIGMVMEDAKEHIDEAAEDREEKAEKLEEKREEQEAFIEKQQENREEKEELLEEIPMEEMLSMNQLKTDVQKEVQDIVEKMKLVAEDIKGVAVDQTI